MRKEHEIRWADAAANLLITLFALALDAVASALLLRRDSPVDEPDDGPPSGPPGP